MNDIDYLIYAQQRQAEHELEMRRQEIERIDFQSRIALVVSMLHIQSFNMLGLVYSAFNPNLYKPGDAADGGKIKEKS